MGLLIVISTVIAVIFFAVFAFASEIKATQEAWNKYFLQFAMAARKGR